MVKSINTTGLFFKQLQVPIIVQSLFSKQIQIIRHITLMLSTSIFLTGSSILTSSLNISKSEFFFFFQLGSNKPMSKQKHFVFKKFFHKYLLKLEIFVELNE